MAARLSGLAKSSSFLGFWLECPRQLDLIGGKIAWRRAISAATEFYNRISDDLGSEAKFDLLKAHANELGYTDLYYARRSFDGGQNLVGNRFIQWDQEWAEAYEYGDYKDHDWVRNTIMEWTGVFRFRDTVCAKNEKQAEFIDLTRRFGRMNGIGIAFRNGSIVPGGMSAIAVHQAELTEEQVNRMHAAANLFDLVIAADLASRTAQMLGLTPREVRLLRLLARGQTAVQIAKLTGSSEQWIRRSFMTIREKLWVGNNVELVLRANALQLID